MTVSPSMPTGDLRRVGIDHDFADGEVVTPRPTTSAAAPAADH